MALPVDQPTDARQGAAAAMPVYDGDERYLRLGRYEHYAQAQAIVDRLSDAGFEVHHTAIVGEGLRLFERVTGRQDAGKASLEGAISGMGTGLLVGVLFSLFTLGNPDASPWSLILTGLVAGAVIGAVIRLIGHLAMGGRRDFTSIQSVQAAAYSVLCHEGHADRARQLLADWSPPAKPR